MLPSRRHIPFAESGREALRGVVALAGRWTAIGGSWDSNGRGMKEDAYIVRYGGGSLREPRAKALCELPSR